MANIYVSYSYNEDISDVKNALSSHYISDTEITLGTDISNLILARITQCDLFVAVIGESNDGHTMFCAGLAYAQNKPVIIVTDQKRNAAFLSIDGYVVVSRNDMQTLQVAVSRLLARRAPKEQIVKSYTSQTKHGITFHFDDTNGLKEKFLELLKNSGSIHNEVIFEATRAGHPTWRPDLAVWIDGVDAALGNPLLFEIKPTLNVEEALKLRNRIKKLTGRQKQDHLIVIYEDGTDEHVLNREVESSGIIFSDFQRLSDSVALMGLSKAIIDLYTRYYK